MKGEVPPASSLSWEVAGRACLAEGARCAKASRERGLGAPVSAGGGVRGESGRPDQGAGWQGLYTGEPASDPSLVKSPWLCVEEGLGFREEAGEREEAGLCVEESGVGVSWFGDEAPTPHRVWCWLSWTRPGHSAGAESAVLLDSPLL